MNEIPDYSPIETQYGISVVGFDKLNLPSGAKIVSLSEASKILVPGWHRFIAFHKDKYSNNGIPVFGGLVVVEQEYIDPEDKPNHLMTSEFVGFSIPNGRREAWGGILEVTNGEIIVVPHFGFSKNLQTPIDTRNSFEDFNKAFEIAMKISEMTGVCLVTPQ